MSLMLRSVIRVRFLLGLCLSFVQPKIYTDKPEKQNEIKVWLPSRRQGGEAKLM